MRVPPNPANVFMDDLDNFDLDDDEGFELVLPFPAQAMQPVPALPNMSDLESFVDSEA